MTFNCQILNGPPFSLNPILLAGINKKYSNKAIPQLIKIIPVKFKPDSHFTSLYFKCPYQASVIKVFENINNTMVNIPLVIMLFICTRRINVPKSPFPDAPVPHLPDIDSANIGQLPQPHKHFDVGLLYTRN
jgi:hypothetical protein